jgi:hypothetical protein
MKNVMANIHPYYDVYVSEKNMGFWKIIMEGVIFTIVQTFQTNVVSHRKARTLVQYS